MDIALQNLQLVKNTKIILDIPNVKLAAQAGPIAVIGRSGSGKTSLLRCLAGLEHYNGSIQFNGGATRPRIGYLDQTATLLPHLTVEKNIILPLQLQKKNISAELFKRLIDTLGINNILHALPEHISGGQQQRVALARTLLYEPEIILCDEPLAALDAITRAETIKLLKTLWQPEQLVFYVTHDLREAEYLCAQALLVAAGEIIAHGTWQELSSQPAYQVLKQAYTLA